MATIDDQLQQLFIHASGDTSGSRRCASALLSLWDGNQYRADLQDLLQLDPAQFDALQVILKHLYTNNTQIDQLVTEKQMKPVIDVWGEMLSVR